MNAAKFWVAAIMGALAWYRSFTGVDLGLDEATVTAIVSALTAGLVWLVPNRGK